MSSDVEVHLWEHTWPGLCVPCSSQTTPYVACEVWDRQLLALRPPVLPEHRRHTCGHIYGCPVCRQSCAASLSLPLSGHGWWTAFGGHLFGFRAARHLAAVGIYLRVSTTCPCSILASTADAFVHLVDIVNSNSAAVPCEFVQIIISATNRAGIVTFSSSGDSKSSRCNRRRAL